MSRWSVRAVIAGSSDTIALRPPLRFVVVVPCGTRKQAETALAAHMYTGSFHRACRAYAHSLQPDNAGIRILSAKHGLLALSDLIEPYDITMGGPGSIDAANLKRQATEAGIAQLPAMLLGGTAYTTAAAKAFPICFALSAIMPSPAGIGVHLATMKRLLGQLPPVFAAMVPAAPEPASPERHNRHGHGEFGS